VYALAIFSNCGSKDKWEITTVVFVNLSQHKAAYTHKKVRNRFTDLGS